MGLLKPQALFLLYNKKTDRIEQASVRGLFIFLLIV